MSTSEVRPDVLPKQAIVLSDEELASGKLSADTRELAGLILSCRGYVVLKNALTLDFVDEIRREMLDIYNDCRHTLNLAETGTAPSDVQKLHVSAKKRATFWYRKARWRIFPRMVAPMSDPRLMANQFVVPVLEDLLGEDFYCKYVSSDTCLDGSILQSPHTDVDSETMFVDNEWRARGYVVNFPIMECGLHNGPIEVWPGGSHMWSTRLVGKYGISPFVQDGRNPPAERAAEYFPSIKLAIGPGEILIRDLAMWHRGTPNPTAEPRTMLTLGFFRSDYYYGYGETGANVDEECFKDLHPRVQRMFAHHFSLKSSLKRKRTAAKQWVKARLKPLRAAS